MVLALLVLNWLPELDAEATQYLDEAITDNLVIYATARAINGLISVIQSIELSVSLGAGLAVHLGEVLDPLNDLIERFSAFVLYALAGLGLQKLVLAATSSLVMKVVTTLALITGLALWLVAREKHRWFLRLVALVLLVRFFLVIEVGTVAVLDRLYFDQQKAEAHSALELAKDRLGTLRQQYMKAAGDQGFFKGIWETASELIGDDQQAGIADITASAVVELIVIMLVRGMLLPLAFIWALIAIGRQLLSGERQPVTQTILQP